MPEFQSSEWQRIINSSKVDYCEGRKIAGLKCKLYATLRPVYFAGKTMYLCGKCIAKLKKRSRLSRPIPRY